MSFGNRSWKIIHGKSWKSFGLFVSKRVETVQQSISGGDRLAGVRAVTLRRMFVRDVDSLAFLPHVASWSKRLVPDS